MNEEEKSSAKAEGIDFCRYKSGQTVSIYEIVSIIGVTQQTFPLNFEARRKNAEIFLSVNTSFCNTVLASFSYTPIDVAIYGTKHVF